MSSSYYVHPCTREPLCKFRRYVQIRQILSVISFISVKIRRWFLLKNGIYVYINITTFSRVCLLIRTFYSDARQFLKCCAIISYLVSMERRNPNKNGTVLLFVLRSILTKLWLFETGNPIKCF